eukprot:scaffold164378_cov48-Prasinocladus_malaysianus.AAC.1
MSPGTRLLRVKVYQEDACGVGQAIHQDCGMRHCWGHGIRAKVALRQTRPSIEEVVRRRGRQIEHGVGI